MYNLGAPPGLKALGGGRFFSEFSEAMRSGSEATYRQFPSRNGGIMSRKKEVANVVASRLPDGRYSISVRHSGRRGRITLVPGHECSPEPTELIETATIVANKAMALRRLPAEVNA